MKQLNCLGAQPPPLTSKYSKGCQPFLQG